MRSPPWSIATYLIVFVCLVDQLSKQWAMSAISKHREIIYLEPWLNITLVMNKGVTFGLFDRLEHSYITYGLIAIAAVVIFFLTRWLWRTHSIIIALALGFVMGGAIGNVVDRVRYGAVVDFLDFHLGSHHWYSFNCADAAIVTGVSMLLLDSLVRGR